MRRFRTHSLCAIVPALLGLASPALAATGVTVVIENLAPNNGTYLTPVWVGFHDGTFDTHDLSLAASMELERLAEDGDTSFMMDALPMTGAGFNQGTIIADTGIPPLAPGETATMTFQLDETTRCSTRTATSATRQWSFPVMMRSSPMIFRPPTRSSTAAATSSAR
jgi:hypothetical protein